MWVYVAKWLLLCIVKFHAIGWVMEWISSV